MVFILIRKRNVKCEIMTLRSTEGYTTEENDRELKETWISSSHLTLF